MHNATAPQFRCPHCGRDTPTGSRALHGAACACLECLRLSFTRAVTTMLEVAKVLEEDIGEDGTR